MWVPKIKVVKPIIILVLIYISAKLILDEFFNLGYAGYIIIALCLALVWSSLYIINIRVNLVLILSLVAFVSSAIFVRNRQENADLRQNSSIIGVWRTDKKGTNELTFEFINSHQVRVIIGANQEEELTYEYDVTQEELTFINNDGSIRFEWDFGYVNQNKFIIVDSEQELIFFRQ